MQSVLYKIEKFTDTFIGNIAVTVLSAAMLIMSSAGFGFSWLVFIAFVPFLYVLSLPAARPVMTGWLLGFLYWVVSLSWMTVTFGYFGGAPAAAAIALLLFVAVSGGFLFFVPFSFVASRNRSPMLLAMVFVALEGAKGKLFFGGVPWLNLAQSQYENITVLQFVSVFGEYGLSFMIMALNVYIFNFLIGLRKGGLSDNTQAKRDLAAIAVIIVITITPGVYKKFNASGFETEKNIAVIQPAYNQEIKWDPAKRMDIIRTINSMAASVNNGGTDLIVLPESSYPASVLDSPPILDYLKKISETTPVIFGTDRRITGDNGTVLYNSMVLMDKGDIQIYDKRHLTPFGEYFPFEKLLEPVKNFFFGPGAMFTAGTEAAVLESGNMKIAPLICFESAFSRMPEYSIKNGANLIVIISNDTWFGKNQGKRQHLAVDTLRAAEYGKTVIRATQDGISAVIAPNGSILRIAEEPVPSIITANIALNDNKTVYYYAGNIWIAFVMALIYYSERKRKRNKNGA